MKFDVGDEVQWKSNGKVKTGTVRAVINAGGQPTEEICAFAGSMSVEFNPDQVRKEESYIVRVDRGQGKKSALYWPLASGLKLLRKAEPPAPSGELPEMENTRSPLGKVCEKWRAQKDKIKAETEALKPVEQEVMEEMKKSDRRKVCIKHDDHPYHFEIKSRGDRLVVHRGK